MFSPPISLNANFPPGAKRKGKRKTLLESKICQNQ